MTAHDWRTQLATDIHCAQAQSMPKFRQSDRCIWMHNANPWFETNVSVRQFLQRMPRCFLNTVVVGLNWFQLNRLLTAYVVGTQLARWKRLWERILKQLSIGTCLITALSTLRLSRVLSGLGQAICKLCLGRECAEDDLSSASPKPSQFNRNKCSKAPLLFRYILSYNDSTGCTTLRKK